MLRRREFLGTGAALMLSAAAGAKTAQPADGVSCILLNLTGGPSQLDTWDLKADAPSSVRGPFRPIRTNVTGIEISEIFPRMARHADKYALVRSCTHEGAAMHDPSRHIMLTGHSFDADTERAHVADATGNHVVLPFHVSPSGGNVEPAESRAQLLPQTSAKFHESCRQAARLVERGNRFVTVNMFESVFGETTWDSHGSAPFSTVADYANSVGPAFDRAYSELLEYLSSRGLLETTLVVAMGEFGRSPKLNPAGGRDHWTRCFTTVLAGGGIRGGQIYGSSDATASEPKDNPVSPQMLLNTIRKAMGLPLEPGAEPIGQLFV